MTSLPNIRPGLSALCLFAALATTFGCGDTRACSECPPVGGSWSFSFDEAQGLSTTCGVGALGGPSEPLELTQIGSSLSAAFEGASLRGTVYEGWEFSLNGSAGGDGGPTTVYAVSGRYAPDVADAGERLVGTWTATEHGETPCAWTRSFDAARTP